MPEVTDVSETLADPTQPDPTGRRDDISRAELRELALNAKAWPFQEARKVLERIGHETPAKGHVLFETGYGPSGLPHIGTFGEVARTTMVRNAFRALTNDAVPTRLVAFSDDMDGLRKVPDNVPNGEAMRTALGLPLTKVPDPFGTHESFGHHNNARLRAFLDAFGFDYTFLSATECYRSGRFDATLLTVLERFDAVMEIMLPTLGEERRATYSPFLPIHPETGVVMQVPIEERNPTAGTIVWRDPASGARFETPVTGGHAKLQWKPDWAMRWVASSRRMNSMGRSMSTKRSASSSPMFGSCHTCGEWVKICPQFPPTSSWFSTALSTPPAMDTCAPTRIPVDGGCPAKALRSRVCSREHVRCDTLTNGVLRRRACGSCQPSLVSEVAASHIRSRDIVYHISVR